MIKRSLATFGIVALLASTFAILSIAPAGAADTSTAHPGTLMINPTSGLPGITVATAVTPAEAHENCESPADLQADIQALFAGINAYLTAPAQVGTLAPADPHAYLAAVVISGAIANNVMGAAATFAANLYATTFVDPVTQNPIGDPGTWSYNSGAGSVEAPNFSPRPIKLIVAAVCLHVFPYSDELAQEWYNEFKGAVDHSSECEDYRNSALPFTTAATAGAFLAGIPGTLNAYLGAIGPATFTDCATAAATEAGPVVVDQANPDGVWIAGFCLLGPNGEVCPAAPAGAPAAAAAAPAAVTANARFTG